MWNRLLLLMGLLIATVPAARAEETAPVEVKIGAYISNLGDFKPAAGTFDAGIWWWALTSKEGASPLKEMELVNGKSTRWAYESVQPANGVQWYQGKLTGTFRQTWDLRNFPFDRHVLTIRVEEAQQDSTQLKYIADTNNSSINEAISIPGWKVTSFAIHGGDSTYNSTFGDPNLSPGASSNYSGATLEIGVQRTEFSSFIQLTAPVYVAFFVTILSFFLNIDISSMSSPRFSLLAGSLFMLVINLRAVNDQTGVANGLGLVHSIHICAQVCALIAILFSVKSRGWLDKGMPATKVTAINRMCAMTMVAAFGVANLVLLYGAAHS